MPWKRKVITLFRENTRRGAARLRRCLSGTLSNGNLEHINSEEEKNSKKRLLKKGKTSISSSGMQNVSKRGRPPRLKDDFLLKGGEGETSHRGGGK